MKHVSRAGPGRATVPMSTACQFMQHIIVIMDGISVSLQKKRKGHNSEKKERKQHQRPRTWCSRRRSLATVAFKSGGTRFEPSRSSVDNVLLFVCWGAVIHIGSMHHSDDTHQQEARSFLPAQNKPLDITVFIPASVITACVNETSSDIQIADNSCRFRHGC